MDCSKGSFSDVTVEQFHDPTVVLPKCFHYDICGQKNLFIRKKNIEACEHIFDEFTEYMKANHAGLEWKKLSKEDRHHS